MRNLTVLIWGVFYFISLNGQAIPFNYSVRLNPVSISGLPGLHSFVVGQSEEKWLIIGGRKDGLHARQPFNAFPATSNNTDIYVIDLSTKQFWTTSVNSLPTGLSEQLQSTNMNFYQDNDSLYIIGGYAYSNSAKEHITFPNLTSVAVSGLIQAITNNKSIAPHFKQITDQKFAVCGGQLGKIENSFYLVGGHRFEGNYNPMGHPTYTQQYVDGIQKFEINNSEKQLSYSNYSLITDQVHLHRRDYNLIPQIFPTGEEGYTAFSGVFQNGIDLPFLYPVDIKINEYTPQTTFNQYLSHYHSSKVALYDSISNTMHSIFLGGMSQYSYINNVLVQDNNVPFVKTISLVSRNGSGQLQENVFTTEMPALIGASAEFILNKKIPHFKSDIIKLSGIISDSVLIGHIYGGIFSPLENPFSSNQTSVTMAHNTIYEVWLIKDQATSINSLNGKNPLLFDVFPNPSTALITLQLELPYQGKLALFVTDSNGKITIEKYFENLPKGKQTIELSNLFKLSKGLYYFNITFDGKYSAIEKVIIIK